MTTATAGAPPASATGMANLSDVLAYNNQHIPHKFLESWDIPLAEAEDLFNETKKWLWLQATAFAERDAGGNPPELFVDDSLAFLDEMWHCFILFTKPYHSFCEQYLGTYIHHAPTTKEEKDAMRAAFEANPDKVRADREAELEVMYTYIYDKLGEETLVKWFSDYPDRYTPEFMNQVRKPIAAV